MENPVLKERHEDRTPQDLPAWTPERVLVIASAITVVAATWALGGAMMLFSPFGAVALLGAIFAIVLAIKPKPWLYLAASLSASFLPLLFVVLMTRGHTLTNPLASAEWTASALLTIATLIALPAGVRGFRLARGRATAPAGERGWMVPYAVVLVCLVVGGATASALAGSRAIGEFSGGGYDFAPEHVVKLATKDFEFTPSEIVVPKGKIVEIAVRNDDVALHTLTYNIGGKVHNHDLLPGATTKFLVRFDQEGVIPMWCKPHHDVGDQGQREGMVGTIRVA